jgi:hypothetical protein
LSLNLTAGDWEVFGNLSINGVTGVDNFAVWTNTASVTIPSGGLFTQFSSASSSYLFGGLGFPSPVLRVSVPTTQTVYLSYYADYTGGPATVNGELYANRVK